tara:strand:+ start:3069 stop:4283 length:1215 start_codon:yes stop_codon:yes gene_type:complete
MATLDVSSAEAILKEYYSNQRVTQLTYKDCPFYALMPKHKDFFGDSYPLPMRVTNPQGASNTFSSAQTNKTASNYKKFSLTRVSDYALASISTEAMLASENNAGAFLQLATAEIDGAFETMKRRTGWALYGNGSGSLGAIAAEPDEAGTTVVTFTNVEDIVKIEVGQTLQFRSGATTRLFATGVSTALVSAVNRDTGAFTLAAAYDSNGTIAADDTVNVVGDYNIKVSGVSAWVPSTAPTATPFFGVDRSIDTTRLGGVRVTSTGKPIEEALIDGARRIGREGIGNPDYVFTGFSRYASLDKSLASKVRYREVSIAGISFKGIEVSGPQGTMTILPDRDCPEDKMYMIDMASWGYYSLKEPIMLLNQDGNRMLREASADAMEVRVGSYAQVGCSSPGSNGVLVF